MLISKDTNPTRDLYYIGGLILQYLIQNNIKSIDCATLLDVLKTKYNDISANLLVLAIDWIYLLGSIDINEKGDLAVCF